MNSTTASSSITLNLSSYSATLVLDALRAAEQASDWDNSVRLNLMDELEAAVAAAEFAKLADWERALLADTGMAPQS